MREYTRPVGSPYLLADPVWNACCGRHDILDAISRMTPRRGYWGIRL